MQTPLEEWEDELESLKKAEGMAFLLWVTEPRGVYHEGKMGVSGASHPPLWFLLPENHIVECEASKRAHFSPGSLSC